MILLTKQRVLVCGALLLTALLLTPLTVLAQEALMPERVSQDQAVAIVREQTEGKVIRVERRIDGSTVVYRVRVLTPDGRLREYQVDSATGALR